MTTFETISHQIRVIVKPVYIERESSMMPGRHVFTYFISIENHSDSPIRLLRRHWVIFDSAGERFNIEGEGVVGKTPVIEPGEAFDYNSFCILESGKGWMKGHYEMETPNGNIKVAIPKFHLVGHFLN